MTKVHSLHVREAHDLQLDSTKPIQKRVTAVHSNSESKVQESFTVQEMGLRLSGLVS
jgi:hypothetical protein